MDDVIYPLIFFIALSYAAVGHGGASGYLAVLALFGYTPSQMAPGALLLNLLVSGVAFFTFSRSGHFNAKLFWPFALTSVPAAFVGGMVQIPSYIYGALLFVALLFAAARLALPDGIGPGGVVDIPSAYVTFPIGLSIGFVSGVVGVGGGIFLSPILLLMKWANSKQAAAVSSAFIWVNSLAGLMGQFHRHGVVPGEWWSLSVAAFLGGLIGARLGAERFHNNTLRRILAGVLGIAACKSLLLVIR